MGGDGEPSARDTRRRRRGSTTRSDADEDTGGARDGQGRGVSAGARLHAPLRRRLSTATRHSPPPRRHSPSLRMSGAGWSRPRHLLSDNARSSTSTRLLQNGKSRISRKALVSRNVICSDIGLVVFAKRVAANKSSLQDFRSFPRRNSRRSGRDTDFFFFFLRQTTVEFFFRQIHARGISRNRACRARKEVAYD